MSRLFSVYLYGFHCTGLSRIYPYRLNPLYNFLFANGVVLFYFLVHLFFVGTKFLTWLAVKNMSARNSKHFSWRVWIRFRFLLKLSFGSYWWIVWYGACLGRFEKDYFPLLSPITISSMCVGHWRERLFLSRSFLNRSLFPGLDLLLNNSW